MQWFLNLSARAKLFLGFGLMIIFLAVVIVTAHTGITAIQESQKQLYNDAFANAVDLKDVRSNQNAIRAALLTMLLLTKRSDQESWLQDIQNREKENEETMLRLLKNGRNDPQFLRRLEEFNAARVAYRQTRDKQLIPLIFQGKIEEAKKLVFGVQVERNEKMRSIANELVDEADKKARMDVEQSEQKANESVRVFAIVGMLALLMGMSMALFLARIIANPLREIAGVAERVASGDLTTTVPSNNQRDEVGVLTQTFGRMTKFLREMAGAAEQIATGNLTVVVKPQSQKDVLGNAFTTMVENLRHTITELAEGVNVLAASASEILAATTQVAAGAAETATAISETTTTVEEVKQTAQLSSQKAKNVSDSSQKATQVAQTGRKSVESSVEGMKRIQTQMESIADSIVKLSEQSQAIGEIMATVNDLAEQSNLLAVNAAIEAAKAGEQGKGFAVVAQEIKTLAEQSKQATAQVRNILSDIQKATSAAVMATEQGSKAVEAGVKQSTEAGESIRVLAETITEAAQAATQIAASSQQQLVGTDQVALAMENIKQASTQNVAGTKQAETAAQSLNELGQRLKQLVEQYKV